MSCEEYRSMISCAVDGELSEEEKRALEAHLSDCEDCRAYREALGALTEELQALPEPPAELKNRVMDSVKAELRRKKLRRLTRYGSLAACLALALGLGLFRFGGRDAKSAAAPMTMMAPAAGMTESASATAENDICEAAEATEEESMMLMANALPDAEAVARSFLYERDGRDYGECSIEYGESVGDYTPVLEDYTPVGQITAVHFETVTVLLDESLSVFGLVE